MTVINSLDQLIEHAVLVAKGEADWEGVDLAPGCATIPVKVCGAGWDHKIDARGAKFIELLQNKLDIFYAAHPNQLPKFAPLLKVEVREGSNELWAFFEPFVSEAVSKLSAEQLVELLKYGLLCGTGLWGYLATVRTVGEGLAHKRETKAEAEKHAAELAARTEKEAVEEARQAQILEVLGKAVDKIGSVSPSDRQRESDYTQPIRDYTKHLAPTDRLSIAGVPPVKVERAREFYKARRRPRSSIRWSGCDGVYNCTGLDLAQRVPRLKIEQDGFPVLAQLGRLSEDESRSLIEKIKERIEQRQMPFRLNLQINVYFNDSGLQYVTVVGVGLQREKLHPHRIVDIPANVVEVFDEFATPEDGDESSETLVPEKL